MSKYTTEVRFICETAAGRNESAGYTAINEILDSAYPVVFSFNFPIYDEAYRSVLCKKILKHYYTREIGAETVGLWKLWLDTRMNEIMPYYNKLYQSAMLDFNPLYDTDITTTHGGTSSSQKTTADNRQDTERVSEITSNNENSSNKQNVTNIGDVQNRYSDTPQGGIEGLLNDTYLTNANLENSSTTSESENTYNGVENGTKTINRNFEVGNSGTETINGTDDYVQRVQGKTGSGSYGKMIQEYRDTLLNIDMMIIDNLSDLFMNLW